MLLLAVIGSGAGAYVLVRKFVRPDGEGAARPDDTADSTLPPLRPEDVSAALQRPENQAALKECYDRARKATPEMAIGRIDLDLTVSPEGKVTDVVLSQHADTEFGTCLIESVRAWTFDASASGVTARVPLIFGSYSTGFPSVANRGAGSARQRRGERRVAVDHFRTTLVSSRMRSTRGGCSAGGEARS